MVKCSVHPACLIFFASAVFVISSTAAPGDVDPSFDPGSGIDHVVSGVTLQQDGKLLIWGGFTTVRGLVRKGLARLNADGSGDPTFDPLIPANADFSSIFVRSDGKSLVAQYFPLLGRGTVLQLNENGTPDPSFKVHGTNTVLSTLDRVLGIDSKGRILVSGFSNREQVSKVARLHSDGELDISFMSIGIKGGIRTAQVEKDDTILIGGNFSIPSAPGKTNVARLTSLGTVDENFRVSVDVGAGGPNSYVSSFALQEDGKLWTAVQFGFSSAIYHLDADGTQDTAFHTDQSFYSISAILLEPGGTLLVADSGKLVRLNANGTFNATIPLFASWLYALARQPDGRIIVGGDIQEIAGVRRPNLARLHPDGSLDLTFDPGAGVNGPVETIALQPDGQLLIGGAFTHIGRTKRTGLARLRANGTLDANFNPELRLLKLVGPPSPLQQGSSGAIAALDFGYHEQEYPATVASIQLRQDAKIIIRGGFTKVDGVERHGVAQLHPDGRLDLSSPLGLGEPPGAIALQTDDKLLLSGGFRAANGTTSRELIRLNADGTIDPDFSSSVTDFFGPIVLQADGKILLLSSSILRLNSNGTLDTNFVSATVPCGRATAAGLQSTGAIIFGAVSPCFGEEGIFRVKTDGQVDPSFKSRWGTNGENGVWSLSVQPDDKILVGFDGAGSFNHAGLLRLNPDGTLDSTFVAGTGAAHPYYRPGVRSLARQPDGKIFVAGYFTSFSETARWSVARLEGDRPVLSIQTVDANNLLVQWTASWNGFELEEAGAFSTTWQPVPGVEKANGSNQGTISSLEGKTRLFRLRQR